MCLTYYYENNFEPSRYELHDALYRDIRSDFGLKAQSVLITVLARYNTVESQMKKKRFKYQDKYTKEWYSVQKNMNWLEQLIPFKSPQNDMVYNRDWNYTKNQMIKIITLEGRVEAECHFDYFDTFCWMVENWVLLS